jgi:uncharacterized membrane protein YfcA
MNYTVIASLCLVGLFAGFFSGLIGIGGGIIIVPSLIYLLGLTQHQAQGTSLLMMLPPVGVLAAINYYKSEHLNKEPRFLIFAGILALTFIVGGYLGSKLSININQEHLKKIFGFVLLLLSIKFIFFK